MISANTLVTLCVAESDKLTCRPIWAGMRANVQAQYRFYTEEIRSIRESREALVGSVKGLLDLVDPRPVGTSCSRIPQIMGRLEDAPSALKRYSDERVAAGVAQTLAMTKSIYPRADIEAIGEGFSEETTPEEALELISQAKPTAEAITRDLGL